MAYEALAPGDYGELLERLKREIGSARTRAALAVNHELISLYWRIDREILARQERDGWGTKIIERLAGDLRAAFPETKGFSARNLHYMRQFAQAWPGSQILPQAVAQCAVEPRSLPARQARRPGDVERSLIAEIERFMIELGAGFAFVGRQADRQGQAVRL